VVPFKRALVYKKHCGSIQFFEYARRCELASPTVSVVVAVAAQSEARAPSRRSVSLVACSAFSSCLLVFRSLRSSCSRGSASSYCSLQSVFTQAYPLGARSDSVNAVHGHTMFWPCLALLALLGPARGALPPGTR
jgi:hypothetical protein